MRIKEIVFLTLLLASCAGQEKNSFPQEDPDSVVISDRISNQRVNAFAEDADGQIWIATFRGLNKYSIHDYHQYFCADDTTGLPDNQINTVFKSSDGHLWAATVNGIAVRTEQGGFQRIPILDDNKNVAMMMETGQGVLLADNSTSILRYDPEENVFRPVMRDLNAFSSARVLDQENRLWIPTTQGLDCYETETFTKVTTVPVDHLLCFFAMVR